MPEPDDTWSDWSAEQTDAQASKVPAPTARYLQYRVTLATENPRASPEVHGLTLRYKTTNQAPEITSFDVPDIDAANLDNPRKLKLNWSAVDPNEDELTYSLFFKKDGWKDWVQLESDLDRKDYDWDTTAIPSGIYQLKVVASDRKDNTAGRCPDGRADQRAVPVAHEPPRVTVKTAGYRRRPGGHRRQRGRHARAADGGIVRPQRQTLDERLSDRWAVRRQEQVVPLQDGVRCGRERMCWCCGCGMRPAMSARVTWCSRCSRGRRR